MREEMFELVKGERERRFQLEHVVRQLRLESEQQRRQSRQQEERARGGPLPPPLERERREALAAATKSEKDSKSRQVREEKKRNDERDEACATAIELKDEVEDLKFGLQALGHEVEGVRTVVETLLVDEEARLQESRWHSEERDRRNSLVPTTTTATKPHLDQQQQQQRREHFGREHDTDRPSTPPTMTSESESGTRASFASVSFIGFFLLRDRFQCRDNDGPYRSWSVRLTFNFFPSRLPRSKRSSGNG